MKNLYVGLLAAVTCTYSMQAAANSLNSSFNFIVEGNVPFSLPASHTEIPLDIKTTSHLDNAVKLASVCSVHGGGSCGELHFGSTNPNCEDLGYYRTCEAGQVKDTSQPCPYDSSYTKCRDADNSCDAGYSTTSCSDGQITEDSYTNEALNTCYLCRDKTCEEESDENTTYYTSIDESCNKGSKTTIHGKECYEAKNVTPKTCEDLGYISSQPENKICDTVNETSTCGQLCYACVDAQCEDNPPYQTDLPDSDIYLYETRNDFAGLTCYEIIREIECSDGNYKENAPDGQICTPVTYGQLKCFDCHPATCEEGGYVASCPSNQTGTKIEYYGKTCYKDCKDNPCTVEGCEKCVDGSTTKCEKCKLGWRLDPNDQKCYEYGYKCCSGNINDTSCLKGEYYQEVDKFETCADRQIVKIPLDSILMDGRKSINYWTYDAQKTFIFIAQCDNFKQTVNKDFNFYVLSSNTTNGSYDDFDCSNTDLNYSGYNTSVYITSPAYYKDTAAQSADYGEIENPKEPNMINLTVKSFTSPITARNTTYNEVTMGLSNVNLTSKEKVVLYDTYLSNSTLTAPEIHLKGDVTLANSKLIADNIYIYSDGSIGTSANTYAVNREGDTYNFVRKNYDSSNGGSFIGSPGNPVAFHIVKDNGAFQYQPIVMQQNNLTIYGYNTENIPIFSEAVNRPLDCYSGTGQHPIYTLTITDMLGKGKSNLFRYFHTHKYDGGDRDPTASCSDGKLIYSKDFNDYSKTFYEEMKNNSYFMTSTSSNSCTLGSASYMVTYEDKINYDNATCSILGLKPSSAPEVCTYYRYCGNDLADDPNDLSEEYRRHWCQSCDTSYNACLSSGNDEQTCLSDCSNENFLQDNTGKYSLDTDSCPTETSGNEGESGYVCTRDETLYQNSSAQNQTLDCYSCKPRYCIVPGEEDVYCSGYIEDIFGKAHQDSHYSALCTILQSEESAESACNRILETCNTGLSNTHQLYLSSIKPFDTLQVLDGSCIVCEGFKPNFN